MAIINFSKAGTMFSSLKFFGDDIVKTLTSFEIFRRDTTSPLVSVNGIANFLGTFKYDKNLIISGGNATQLGLELDLDKNSINESAYTVTDTRISSKIIRNFFENGDRTSFERSVFSGKDDITGSLESDQINGYAGIDKIFGSAGDDWLMGGAGKDLLRGGTGIDHFMIDSLKSSNIDTIMDFGFGGEQDYLNLSSSVFTNLNLGVLDNSSFVIGSHPLDDQTRILLNGTHLYYDPDGSGSAKSALFATINIMPEGHISASNFLISPF